jgi:hypothetical protein
VKKPDLAILLGSPKHEDGDGDGGEEHDAAGAKKDAAEAFIDAVHDKDPEALLSAFYALRDLCMEDEEEEEKNEEKGEEMNDGY